MRGNGWINVIECASIGYGLLYKGIHTWTGQVLMSLLVMDLRLRMR